MSATKEWWCAVIPGRTAVVVPGRQALAKFLLPYLGDSRFDPEGLKDRAVIGRWLEDSRNFVPGNMVSYSDLPGLFCADVYCVAVEGK